MKTNQYRYSQEPFFPDGKNGGKCHEDKVADKAEVKLPKGWETASLGSITKIYDGTHYTPKYTEKGIPFYSVEQVTSNNFSKTKFVSEADYMKACKRAKIEKDDILMTRIGDIGTAKHVDWEPKADFYVSLVLIKSNEAFDSRYMSYYINGSSFKRELWFRTIHVAFPVKINLGEIGKCAVCLPPLHEQKAIADTLATWDEAIEKTECLIVAKQKQFKWLLRTLITDQCDKTPGWERVKIGDLLNRSIKIEKGKPLTKKSVSEGSVPVVAGGQTYAYYTNTATHTMQTVTVSASGAYAGFVWLHDYPIWASDCNVLYTVNGSTQYLYYALKMAQRRIYALQSGGAQPHIYAKDIKSVSIPWTSTKNQEQVTNVLHSAQQEIDILGALVQKYKIQKRGLMQKLLTGKWRVTN